MSKEQEPIRSRRELRETNQQQNPGAAHYPRVPFVAPTPAVDRHGRRTQGGASVPGAAAPSEAKGTAEDHEKGDAAASGTAQETVPAAPRERESQTRARDRAALRAYKELVDAAPEQGGPLPSRRALRQAQLDAERAPVTSITPVVRPLKGSPGTKPVQPLPQAVPPVPQSAPQSAAKQAPAAPDRSPSTKTPGNDPSDAAVPSASRPRMGRRAAAAAPDALPRDRHATAASSKGAEGPDKNTQSVDSSPGQGSASVRGSASGQGTAPTNGTAPGVAAAQGNAGLPDGAVVGSDPAGPGPVPGTPYPSFSVGPGSPAGKHPSTGELRRLADERAQAERAAVLDQRAQARERLAQESAKTRRTPADPTSTNNLAMVTPLEFVDLPGMDRPVMRPPATTHVPIVTRSTPKLAPARRSTPGKQAAGKPVSGRTTPSKPAPSKPATAKPGAPRDPQAERFDAALAARTAHRPGPGTRPLTGGRSNTLQRAEAMVSVARPGTSSQPGPVSRTQMPPLPADYAHGLEPLDAVTAGLGRTKRNLLIQWGSIILGGAALVVGAVLFITALAR